MYLNVRLICFITVATILNSCKGTVNICSFLGPNPDDVLNSNSSNCANVSRLVYNAGEAAAKFINCKLFKKSAKHNFLQAILSLPNATVDPIKSGDLINANLSSVSIKPLVCCITDPVPLDAPKTQQVELCELETDTKSDLAYYVYSFLVCMEATTGYATTNMISLTLINVFIYCLLGIKNGKYENDGRGLNAAKASELLNSIIICKQTVE